MLSRACANVWPKFRFRVVLTRSRNDARFLRNRALNACASAERSRRRTFLRFFQNVNSYASPSPCMMISVDAGRNSRCGALPKVGSASTDCGIEGADVISSFRKVHAGLAASCYQPVPRPSSAHGSRRRCGLPPRRNRRRRSPLRRHATRGRGDPRPRNRPRQARSTVRRFFAVSPSSIKMSRGGEDDSFNPRAQCRQCAATNHKRRAAVGDASPRLAVRATHPTAQHLVVSVRRAD
jgi:hypothetical protein